MKEKIEQIKRLKQSLRDELAKEVQDKSKSLDERWEYFVKMGDEVLDPKPYIHHFKSFDIKTKYESIRNPIEDKLCEWMDRNETIHVENIVESLEEWKEEGEEFTFKQWDKQMKDKPSVKVKITQELIDNFKEECMDQLIHSYQFDW